MIGWALTFLTLMIVTGFFGFGGMTPTYAGVAQILFVIFLVLFVVNLIASLMRRRP